MDKALKQKSDIEHYRNKLRLKAKRKGYYDFPLAETSRAQPERKKMYEKSPKELEHVLDPDPGLCAPFAESRSRCGLRGVLRGSRTISSMWRRCTRDAVPVLSCDLRADLRRLLLWTMLVCASRCSLMSLEEKKVEAVKKILE